MEIPGNIGFIFLPPYSPELNPAEKVWQLLKKKFTNKLHHSLEQVSDFITQNIQPLTSQVVSLPALTAIFLMILIGLFNNYKLYNILIINALDMVID